MCQTVEEYAAEYAEGYAEKLRAKRMEESEIEKLTKIFLKGYAEFFDRGYDEDNCMWFSAYVAMRYAKDYTKGYIEGCVEGKISCIVEVIDNLLSEGIPLETTLKAAAIDNKTYLEYKNIVAVHT